MGTIFAILYSSIILLLSPIAALIIFFNPRRDKNIIQRFGLWDIPDSKKFGTENWIWFHAASIGELEGLSPIISRIRVESSNCKLLITTTSSSALKFASEFGEYSALIPFDSIFLYIIALLRVGLFGRTKKIIITETEIWPGLLWFCFLFKIEIIWVNAKIQEKTFIFLRKIAFFVSPTFQNISKLFCQTDLDSSRYFKIGIPEDKILVFGNTKYSKQHLTREQARKIITASSMYPIITFGNVRPREEKIIFPILEKLQKEALIYFVPRHEETYHFFENQFKLNNFEATPFLKYQETSKANTLKSGIVFVNTFGVLKALYAQSDIVVSCASFSKEYQGHNLLEAAPYGVVLITGPYNSSTDPLLRELTKNDACIVANDKEQLLGSIIVAMTNAAYKTKIGENLRKFNLTKLPNIKLIVSSILDRGLDND